VLWACLSQAPACAQSPEKIVGLLSVRSADDSSADVAAFVAGLQEEGFAHGRNVTIAYRWADGDYEKLKLQAA